MLNNSHLKLDSFGCSIFARSTPGLGGSAGGRLGRQFSSLRQLRLDHFLAFFRKSLSRNLRFPPKVPKVVNRL